MQFAAHCVRPGSLFIACLLRKLRTCQNDHVTITIDNEFKKDLLWWHKFSPVYNGCSIIPKLVWSPPHSVVETDACLTGCGGICSLYFFHTVFPQFISVLELHINALELLTILTACKIWGKYWKGIKKNTD